LCFGCSGLVGCRGCVGCDDECGGVRQVADSLLRGQSLFVFGLFWIVWLSGLCWLWR
jgi:hypothetical protein